MMILALDPGATLIGWSVLGLRGEQTLEGEVHTSPYLHLVDCGLLEPFQGENSSFNQQANQILWQALGHFSYLIGEHGVTHVAWEIVPSFGQYAHRDKIVAVVNGLKTLTFTKDLYWYEQAPMAVKKAATGNPKATKKEMKEAALTLYPDMGEFRGKDGPAYDVYDSALIGYTSWQKNSWVQGPEVLDLVKAG